MLFRENVAMLRSRMLRRTLSNTNGANFIRRLVANVVEKARTTHGEVFCEYSECGQ